MSKQLPQLKQGGPVVSAQPTTTNRTAITTQKLLRTHNTVMEAWTKQGEWNSWDETIEANLKDGLTWNLDETTFRVEDGNLKIIGSAARQKHEKNSSDCQQSITVARMGLAAGVEGPRFFLGKGKEESVPSLRKAIFSHIHKAPVGSCVNMTPNAYMTNTVWNAIAPDICAGIHASKGVCEHPELWVVLSIDGFGSHLQGNALQVYAASKILVFKEERDTSHVSQAYDQSVAKSNKRFTRAFISL